MSKEFLVLVLTEPTEGAEEAFNDYYESTHLDEVLQTTHFETARRFRLAGQAGESCPLPYLAAYQTHAETADEVLADLSKKRSERQQSDALNRRTGRAWVFEAIGPEHS